MQVQSRDEFAGCNRWSDVVTPADDVLELFESPREREDTIQKA